MKLSVLHAPILNKELIEQAARPRTYALRVAYATLLFGVFIAFAYNMTLRFDLGDSVAGSGRMMFHVLVSTQFLGIVLFLPAVMSGALTEEKERRTLELLLLTRLRPRHILWEKFVGRLVPVLMFLFLSTPLLAVCYAFGGLAGDDLLVGAYVLLLTCLQVGALALMCSAFCRTSLSAFFSSYALLAVLYLLIPLADIRADDAPSRPALILSPHLLLDAGDEGGFGLAIGRSYEILGSVFVLLAMARLFLVRRAFLAPRRLLVAFFRRLDGFIERHGLAFPRRRRHRLLRPREDLPDRQPIAWREVAKRPLVKPSHLAYMLVLLEAPVLLILAVHAFSPALSQAEGPFLALLGVLWVLAAAGVLGMSVNAISAERSAQTLEALLTTPIAGRDIVRQKLRGIRRMIFVFLAPFTTLFLVQIWWASTRFRAWRMGPGVQQLCYVALACLSVALFLWLFTWFAMWVGLRTRSRPRAIVASVVALLVWGAAPILAFVALQLGSFGVYYTSAWLALLPLASPVACIGALELYPGPYWEVNEGIGLLIVAMVFHGGLLFLFRGLCLRRADRYLGRAVPRRRASWTGFLYAPPEE